MASALMVWIDQDLCTGDGICEEICGDVFTARDDGLWVVKEEANTSGPRSCSTAKTETATDPTVVAVWPASLTRSSTPPWRRPRSARVSAS